MRAAAKCMRQLCENKNENDSGRAKTMQEIQDEVFLHVYAPIMMEYVEWVLREARREGKQRLYFLARDGYMMYLAACRLAEDRNLDIAVRYLKISRLAVRSALSGIGAEKKDTAAENCRDQAIAYFRQEGLLDDVPFALADSGWVGSMQYGLQQLLSYAGKKPIRLQGYYFGLYERPKGTTPKQYRHFYFGERNIRRKIRFSNCLLETVCSAGTGMTRGYRPVAGVNEVCLEAVESDGGNPNAAVMERFAKLLSLYVEAYLVEEHKAEYGRMRAHKASFCMVERLLQPMMGNPTSAEAEAFGSLLFSDRVSEECLQPVAAVWKEDVLDSQDICNRLLVKLGIRKDVLPESAWMEGSIVRLGIEVQKYLWQERWYKRLMYLRKAVCR